tara:strand:+ start:92 stop:634 length:543 start_codon:yes stop_codon:yes gene_type:complete
MAVLFIGYLAEFVGLTILFLPLLFRELSRPRDSIWGALIIIVGLMLITASDRFVGIPAIAVVFQAFIFGRLILEVSQNRLRVLSEQEIKSLQSIDRFKININQSFIAFAKLGPILFDFIKSLQPKEKTIKKKWIRPEVAQEETSKKIDNFDTNDSKQLHKFTSPDQIASPQEENIASKDS